MENAVFKFCLMCQEKGWAQISQPRFENALYTWQIIASKFDKKGFGIPSFGLHILFFILNPTSISPQAPMKSKYPWLHCKCLEGFTGSLQGNFKITGIAGIQRCWIGKSKPDLTRIKIIQHNSVGGVLDCFYTSEEAWISIQHFLSLWINIPTW